MAHFTSASSEGPTCEGAKRSGDSANSFFIPCPVRSPSRRIGEALVHSEQLPERRRARRYGLRLSAVVRERGRGRIPIRVIDISTNGCRIELSCGLLVGSW